MAAAKRQRDDGNGDGDAGLLKAAAAATAAAVTFTWAAAAGTAGLLLLLTNCAASNQKKKSNGNYLFARERSRQNNWQRRANDDDADTNYTPVASKLENTQTYAGSATPEDNKQYTSNDDDDNAASVAARVGSAFWRVADECWVSESEWESVPCVCVCVWCGVLSFCCWACEWVGLGMLRTTAARVWEQGRLRDIRWECDSNKKT